MPDELAFELDQFDVRVIEFANDPWASILAELGEFFGEAYSAHAWQRMEALSGCQVRAQEILRFWILDFGLPEVVDLGVNLGI